MKANKRIICTILALLMCLSAAVISASAEETAEPTNQMYKDIVFEALGEYVNPEYHFYRCEYAYNADGSTIDEGETPDYILAWASAEAVHCTVTELVIGDYYFYLPHAHSPYDLGYFICSTKENRCYSLEEAWYLQLPEIEKILAMVGTPCSEVDNNLTRYRDRIISEYRLDEIPGEIEYRVIMEYSASGETAEGATPDYAVIFAHAGGILCWEVREHFGNYMLREPAVYNPGYIIYSIGEDKIYEIRDAYYQGLPGMDKVLEAIGYKYALYGDVFEEYLKSYVDEDAFNHVEGWYYYDELYYYSYQQQYGVTEMGRVNPDYVLVKASTYFASPIYSYDVFGDYIIQGGCGEPYCGNYFIYTPKDGRIYTLREAFDAQIKDVEKVFTDYDLGYLTGDADGDRKLTIKDATYIQKCLANFKGFELKDELRGHNISEPDDGTPDIFTKYIEDFDNNDTVNIKDATAIQKKLAKITE